MEEKHRKRWLHYFGGNLRMLLILLGLLTVFSTPAMATHTPVQGGPGGNYFRTLCGSGSYLVGLAGRRREWIDQIATICAPWLPVRRAFAASSAGPSYGSSLGGYEIYQNCPDGDAIYGRRYFLIVGDSGEHKFIGELHATCVSVLLPVDTQTFEFALCPGQGGRGENRGESFKWAINGA